MIRRITIVSTRVNPQNTSVNTDIHAFCDALGLFSLRDKESSLYRVFVEILKASKNNGGLTSDELAARTQLSRGTVVYHLKKLFESGIIIADHNKYYLRVQNLSQLVDELTRDVERSLNDIAAIAHRIDEELEL